MIKKAISILVLFCCASVFAQTPKIFNYQAVARDSSGEILSNSEIAIEFQVLKGSSSGITVFKEQHTVTTSSYGLFTLEVGNGNPKSKNTIADIEWGVGEYWLQVAMDPNAGNSYSIIGSSKLLSVPYALHAETVTNDKDTKYTAGKGLKLVGNEFSIADEKFQQKTAVRNSPFSTVSAITSNALGDISRDSFVFGSSSINDIPGTNDDKRVIFCKNEGAFRAGEAQGTQWDITNVGDWSVAFGFNNTASGDYSSAFGWGNIASGRRSFAIGFDSKASADVSFAAGYRAQASGSVSTAFGFGTTAEGTFSTAFGYKTIASGQGSITMGNSTKATERYSVAIGERTIASGMMSFASGNGTVASGWASFSIGASTKAIGRHSFGSGLLTSASGDNSSAFGLGTTAIGENALAIGANTSSNYYASLATGFRTISKGFASSAFGVENVASAKGEFVVGLHNVIVEANPDQIKPTNRLFVVGNGYNPTLRSDAFVVLMNGNATLSGTLTQNSDKRLKTRITPLENTLEKIEKINGVNYIWKDTKKRGSDLQLGVIAQEVQAQYPELINADAKGILSVNYNGLVPVLLEAIKELKYKVEMTENALSVKEKGNKNLKSELSFLSAKVDAIISELAIDIARSN